MLEELKIRQAAQGRRSDSRFRAAPQMATGLCPGLPGAALADSLAPDYIDVAPMGLSVCGFADKQE
jgi:hypothetical protein